MTGPYSTVQDCEAACSGVWQPQVGCFLSAVKKCDIYIIAHTGGRTAAGPATTGVKTTDKQFHERRIVECLSPLAAKNKCQFWFNPPDATPALRTYHWVRGDSSSDVLQLMTVISAAIRQLVTVTVTVQQ
jgi:hypothetical protein